MSCDTLTACRLRITAEPDPAVLARVLERFQNLNVLPRRVISEVASTGIVHVQVDVIGISAQTLSLISAKVAQVPCVLNAYWHVL